MATRSKQLDQLTPGAPHWSEMEPAEEVVLSTGRFGAAEIANYIAEHADCTR